MEQRRNAREEITGVPRQNPSTSGIVRQDCHMRISDLNCTVQRHDGNTARLARRSDDALGVRVSVAPLRSPGSFSTIVYGIDWENVAGLVTFSFTVLANGTITSQKNKERHYIIYGTQFGNKARFIMGEFDRGNISVTRHAITLSGAAAGSNGTRAQTLSYESVDVDCCPNLFTPSLRSPTVSVHSRYNSRVGTDIPHCTTVRGPREKRTVPISPLVIARAQERERERERAGFKKEGEKIHALPLIVPLLRERDYAELSLYLYLHLSLPAVSAERYKRKNAQQIPALPPFSFLHSPRHGTARKLLCSCGESDRCGRPSDVGNINNSDLAVTTAKRRSQAAIRSSLTQCLCGSEQTSFVIEVMKSRVHLNPMRRSTLALEKSRGVLRTVEQEKGGGGRGTHMLSATNGSATFAEESLLGRWGPACVRVTPTSSRVPLLARPMGAMASYGAHGRPLSRSVWRTPSIAHENFKNQADSVVPELIPRCTLMVHDMTHQEADEGEMRFEWSSVGMQGRGKTGDPRENPPTSIVRHDSHMRKSASDPSGIKPRSLWWEASRLTVQPSWPPPSSMIRIMEQRGMQNHVSYMRESGQPRRESNPVHLGSLTTVLPRPLGLQRPVNVMPNRAQRPRQIESDICGCDPRVPPEIATTTGHAGGVGPRRGHPSRADEVVDPSPTGGNVTRSRCLFLTLSALPSCWSPSPSSRDATHPLCRQLFQLLAHSDVARPQRANTRRRKSTHLMHAAVGGANESTAVIETVDLDDEQGALMEITVRRVLRFTSSATFPLERVSASIATPHCEYFKRRCPASRDASFPLHVKIRTTRSPEEAYSPS
ncbi:hypothetical protein PR048_014141 [Dryococelus australis]|uniref:Uncharacterized protein n=1 Tax=Dryococelus australis TaxID=614101 RepID=A0ABQ9HDK0_9NEOP|nr:hypothetical protein PR048_014141 [Dryococelus australis]